MSRNTTAKPKKAGRRKPAAGGTTQRLYKVLSHPLRQRILVALHELGEGSPAQLAEKLSEPIGNVSYHVKVLIENDAVELVRTRPVRGALEHFYRPISRPEIDDEHWARLPISVRRRLFDDTLQDIWEHAVAAAEAAGFDDERAHVSWTSLELDEEGYAAVADLLGRTLERVMEIQAEAKARAIEGEEAGEPSHRTEVAMLHFHRAP